MTELHLGERPKRTSHGLPTPAPDRYTPGINIDRAWHAILFDRSLKAKEALKYAALRYGRRLENVPADHWPPRHPTQVRLKQN